jgi:HSP20 family molecular chaperone IbpA
MWPKIKSVAAPIMYVLLGALLLGLLVRAKPETAAAVLGIEPRRQTVQDHLNSILQDQNKLFSNFDTVFDDDFFRQNDPFEEMRKFREQLGRRVQNPKRQDSFFANPFDSWFGNRFGGGSVADISKREDEKFVYYDIHLDGLEGSTLQANVENGYLTVSGEVKRQIGTNSGSLMHSSFRRSFPLPTNIDGKKMEMSSAKDQITLKFPKLKLGSRTEG